MLKSKHLLIVAGILIIVGLFKPDLSKVFPVINSPSNNTIVVVTPPSDDTLKQKCKLVIDVLSNGGSDRYKDGKRLSDLYMDLATLIELDGADQVIKTTEEITQANSLSGLMLRLNIKSKYPGLGDAAQVVISSQIGDDIVPLDAELRIKAAEAFRGLAWACNEGSK